MMSEQDVARWGKESPTPDQLKEFFAQITSGRVTRTRMQGFLSDGCVTLVNDKRSVGWKLLNDQWRLVNSINDLEKIEPLAFLHYGENSIAGEEMMLYAKRLKANLSQDDLGKIAKFLNKSPDHIDVKAFVKKLDKRCLVATRTVWADKFNQRQLAVLYRGRDEWEVRFRSLEQGWNSDDCLGRLAI